jgi:hypothetical protein
MSQTKRAYLYRIGAAVVPLLVLLGVITQEVATEVLIIWGAVLAVSEAGLLMAAANTPTKQVAS